MHCTRLGMNPEFPFFHIYPLFIYFTMGPRLFLGYERNKRPGSTPKAHVIFFRVQTAACGILLPCFMHDKIRATPLDPFLATTGGACLQEWACSPSLRRCSSAVVARPGLFGHAYAKHSRQPLGTCSRMTNCISNTDMPKLATPRWMQTSHTRPQKKRQARFIKGFPCSLAVSWGIRRNIPPRLPRAVRSCILRFVANGPYLLSQELHLTGQPRAKAEKSLPLKGSHKLMAMPLCPENIIYVNS